jgi:hypothetical protein
MARIAGRRGQLYVGLASSAAVASPVTFLNKWSIEFTTPDINVTAFGDTNQVYVAGLPDAAGDFGGWYDTATAQLYTAAQDGLARNMYLYPDNSVITTYWFGTALFDFKLDSSVDGAVAISGGWKAASAIAKIG